MFIVLELNQDEFRRGNSRPVHKFETQTDLEKFLSEYGAGPIARLEIFDCTEYKVNFSLDIKAK